MNETGATIEIALMMRSVGIPAESGEPKGSPLAEAIAHGSKRQSENRGNIDLWADVSGRHMIVVENKYGYRKHVVHGHGPYFVRPCLIDMSVKETVDFAECGAVYYLKSLLNNWPHERDPRDHFLALACTMWSNDDDPRIQEIIIRPFYLQVRTGTILRLPSLDDFRALSPRRIDKYVEGCEHLANTFYKPDVASYLNVVNTWAGRRSVGYVDHRLFGYCLLAMGVPKFSRTYVGDQREVMVRLVNSFWLNSTSSGLHINSEARAVLKKAGDDFLRAPKGFDYERLSRELDAAFLHTAHYAALYDALTDVASTNKLYAVAASLLGLADGLHVVDGYCSDGKLLAMCCMHNRDRTQNRLTAVCRSESHMPETLYRLILHGMCNIDLHSQETYKHAPRPDAAVTDCLFLGTLAIDFMRTTMTKLKRGGYAVFILTDEQINGTDPKMSDARRKLAESKYISHVLKVDNRYLVHIWNYKRDDDQRTLAINIGKSRSANRCVELYEDPPREIQSRYVIRGGQWWRDPLLRGKR